MDVFIPPVWEPKHGAREAERDPGVAQEYRSCLLSGCVVAHAGERRESGGGLGEGSCSHGRIRIVERINTKRE